MNARSPEFNLRAFWHGGTKMLLIQADDPIRADVLV